MESSKRPFRAVIVGAGPVGLITAHCLCAAKIDFVVLERRKSIPEESGAGIGLWPQGVRLLDQLKLLEAAEQISKPMEFGYHMYPDGSEIAKVPVFELLEKRYTFILVLPVIEHG
jgi:2-polyprenyl-6-methoxyphenol hydroxylase-like FAD-dependent oxidoreductase